MLRPPLAFIYWLPKHPGFCFTYLSKHSQLGYLWLPTPNYAAPVLLTGCYTIRVVT